MRAQEALGLVVEDGKVSEIEDYDFEKAHVVEATLAPS